MIVTCMCEDRLYNVFLPEKIRGQYWMENLEESINSVSRKLFNIEAVDDKWRIWANKTLKLYTEDGTPADEYIDLEEGHHFIAMNNPDNSVTIRSNVLKEYVSPQSMEYETPEEVEEQIYYRSPRFKREITPLFLANTAVMK